MAFKTGPAVPASDVKATGTRGISDKGRSATYRKRGLWAIKKKHGGEFPKTAKAEKKAEEPAAKVQHPCSPQQADAQAQIAPDHWTCRTDG